MAYARVLTSDVLQANLVDQEVKRLTTEMRTDEDWLAWVLHFVNIESPIMRLSKTGLEALRHDLAAFLGFADEHDEPLSTSGIYATVLKAPWPWEYTKRQLDNLQRDSRQMIEDTVCEREITAQVDGRELRVTVKGGLNPTELSTEEAGERILIDVVGPPERRIVRIGGPVRVAFLHRLALLLAGEAGAKVLSCPVCGTLFRRVRRQKYCSRKCTNKASWGAVTEEKKLEYRDKRYKENGWTQGARSKKGEK